MKELNDKDKEVLDDLLKKIGQSLIGVMDIMDIPNFINAKYKTGEDKYELKFTKIKKQVNN